ncbi:DUF349 domain-containing protein [Porphyromonadaceae bacterium OttesenSCG-928-L07]|nr:DUF349 domain-containing protein [Porphyromonadaceae bacterium OttesenSCG-928-L07]
MEENTVLNEEMTLTETNNNEENVLIAEEETEKNESAVQNLPMLDLENSNTEDIISYARSLAETYTTSQIKTIMDKLPEFFDRRYKQEYDKALKEFTAQDLPIEEFKYESNAKERFYAIVKLYKDRRAAEIRQIEAEREQNLKAKLQLVEELKELVQKEESLNKTFQDFKDIQEKWRNIGPVPQSKVNDLLETYHLHVENFYNYIKINKELRDLDLKRNLDDKTALCIEAEKLLENSDTNDAFKQLQVLHARWKEVGPVPKEQKEALWERFKATTDNINEKYHNFFENLKKEQESNLKVKEEICERAENVSKGEYKSISEWNKAAQQLIEMQEEWKHVGTVLLKERNKIYKRFRTACDEFFDRKRQFHKSVHNEQEENLALKIELCEKVEAIKDSTDWKVTTDKIITYQKKWKSIGPAPQKHSNKVWNRFRAACDAFFNNKKEHFKDIDSEQDKNLELKKALIEEVKQFKPIEDNEENFNALKEFQKRWGEIGFVPIKEKEIVNEEFRTVINAHFDKMNLDEFDKKIEKFKVKLQNMDSSENKEFKIVNERDKLINKIRQLEADISTWENNIGFISKSQKSENLIKELSNKIEQTKQRLNLLLEKLKALDSII